MNTFELEQAPSQIIGMSSKTKGMKKMKVWIDITKDKYLKQVIPLFDGALDEGTTKRLAAAGSGGLEWKRNNKLGESLVKFFDPKSKELVLEGVNVQVGKPKIKAGREAKTFSLVVDLEIFVPKKSLSAVEDYLKSDILTSIANQQLDHVDEAQKKIAAAQERIAKKQTRDAAKKTKKVKNGAVEWQGPV